MNQIENELFTYKMLIPAAPYPFEGKAVASTEEQAFRKIKWQATQCGATPKRGRPLAIEKMGYCKA